MTYGTEAGRRTVPIQEVDMATAPVREIARTALLGFSVVLAVVMAAVARQLLGCHCVPASRPRSQVRLRRSRRHYPAGPAARSSLHGAFAVHTRPAPGMATARAIWRAARFGA